MEQSLAAPGPTKRLGIKSNPHLQRTRAHKPGVHLRSKVSYHTKRLRLEHNEAYRARRFNLSYRSPLAKPHTIYLAKAHPVPSCQTTLPQSSDPQYSSQAVAMTTLETDARRGLKLVWQKSLQRWLTRSSMDQVLPNLFLGGCVTSSAFFFLFSLYDSGVE